MRTALTVRAFCAHTPGLPDLSVGDRASIAIGRELGLPILTADRNWARIDLGVTVEVIR